jgi:hypothetical protein
VGGEVDTADLVWRRGRWWLHVVVTLPQPDVVLSEAVVGVDLGLTRPAVTSNSRFVGKRAWKAVEGRYFKLRRALQKRGTKSAKRHLRKLRGKQARFRLDCDHVLSTQVVAAVPPGSTIVLENLTTFASAPRSGARRKPAAASTAGHLPNSQGLSSTRQRSAAVGWQGLTPGIPRRPVAAAGMSPATTAVPVTCSDVGNVATRCMPT